jgi:hypothetical protein
MSASVAAGYLEKAQVAITGISTLLAPLPAISVGSKATSDLAGALNVANGLIASALTSANGQIAALTQAGIIAGTVLASPTAIDAINDMKTAAQATLDAATAVVLASYIGRAAINVGLATNNHATIPTASGGFQSAPPPPVVGGGNGGTGGTGDGGTPPVFVLSLDFSNTSDSGLVPLL